MKPKHAVKATLPTPAQLAQLAAPFLANCDECNPAQIERALQQALRLYLRAARFCDTQKSASLGKLALVAGDTDLYTEDLMCENVADWPEDVPRPEKFPATLDDFFRLIVKAKTPADSTKRFRDFLTHWLRFRRWVDTTWVRLEKPDMNKAKAAEFAVATLAKMKDGDQNEGYFAKSEWLAHSRAYLFWWRGEKTRKAQQSAESRKKKH